jgi:transglutaminase-like putative cysteine protease
VRRPLAWVALVAVDLVAVLTLRRGFEGPDAAVVAVAALLAVHAVSGIVRSAARGRRGVAALVAPLGVVVAPLLGFAVPLWAVLGRTTAGGLPTRRTWAALASEVLRGAHAFEVLRAPVPADGGLVLGAGWLAASVGLAAELLFSEPLPPLLACVPAAALVVFDAVLGTPDWRTPTTVAEVLATVAFLLLCRRERLATRGVRLRTWGASLSLLLAAGGGALLAGGFFPGVGSPPLVSVRGGRPGAPGAAGTGSVASGAGVQLSEVVDVAPVKVRDSNVPLFVVTASAPTYEELAILNEFDGVHWTPRLATPSGPLVVDSAVPSHLGPGSRSVRAGGGPLVPVEQSVRIEHLGGFDLPFPVGVPSAVGGAGQVSRDELDGALTIPVPLRPGLSYRVLVTAVDPSSPGFVSAAEAGVATGPGADDYALPGSPPPALVALAHEVAAGATTPLGVAEALESYFTSGRFRYELPAASRNGAVRTAGEGYAALVRFLTVTRAGFCQQFASAFAVLARIDGLASRVVVGFLPGTLVAPDTYLVTGADAHAWPEVYLGSLGWVPFEPTPGRSLAAGPLVGAAVRPGPGGPTAARRAPNLRAAPAELGRGKAAVLAPASAPRPSRARSRTRHDLALALAAVLALLAVAWLGALGASRWRRYRRARAGPVERVLADWEEALRALLPVGVRARPSETYRELAERVHASALLDEDGVSALRQLARAATVAAFAPELPGEVVGTAARELRRLRRSARRRSRLVDRLGCVLDPRGPAARLPRGEAERRRRRVGAGG